MDGRKDFIERPEDKLVREQQAEDIATKLKAMRLPPERKPQEPTFSGDPKQDLQRIAAGDIEGFKLKGA